MSRKKLEPICCPHCGIENLMEKWESINTALDPKAKEKLLDGSLFTANCTGCKKELTFAYDFLYHDMEQKLLIFRIDNEEEDPFLLLHRRTGEDGPKGYVQRIVSSHKDVVEKLHLRTDGVDDRVMELVKHVLRLQMGAEEGAELRYLSRRNGVIHLYRGAEGSGASFALDEELYRDALIRTGERLMAYDQCHRIDAKWAKEAVEKGILA